MRRYNYILILLMSSVFIHLFLCVSGAIGAENRFSGKTPIGTWLLVVGDEVKTRTLTIKSIDADKDGYYLADCEYGYTGGKQNQVKAKLWSEGNRTRLSFDVPAKNSIAAVENDDGSFTGTYIYKNGTSKPVSITRPSKNIETLRFSLSPQSKISVVYFRSFSCPYCSQWEGYEKGNFIKMEEYAQINFSTVNRDLEREQLPDDLKWLSDKNETGRGTPYFIVLVNQTIVLKAFGKDNWNRMVLPLLKSLVAQKKSHP